MSGILPSGLRLVAGKLKDLASDIVTIRTGTVVTDYAPMSATLVTLDNDPESATVQALALNGPLPSGARVAMIAYPPRGLLVIGTMVDTGVLPSGLIVITTTRAFNMTEVLGAKQLKVTTIGGGGAGGGTVATAGGSSAFGSGGSSGGLAIAMLDVGALAASFTATVGAGGTGVNGGNGNSGVTTSFSTYCAATGGGGGQASGSGTAASVSAISSGPGTGTIGDILLPGNFGLVGLRLAATAGMAGAGAPGPYGGNVTTSNFTTAAGVSAAAANGSGSGGGGAYGGSGAASQIGGVGASGIIIIEVIR